VLSAEFAAGRMSFAKIRALTRIATPVSEAGLAELAGPMTASQLERFARAHRKVSRADDGHADVLRRLTWRQDGDGSLSLTVRLPPADGAVVLQALRAATGDLGRQSAHEEHEAPDRVSAETPADRKPADAPVVTPASLADALVEIAGAFLAGKIETASNPDIYQVIVHVGTGALTAEPTAASDHAGVSAGTLIGHPADPSRCHIEDGPAVSPATAQAIACCANVSWMLHDHKGDPLDVGRRHRTPATGSTCTTPSGLALPTPRSPRPGAR
jgi:hypothetical protein